MSDADAPVLSVRDLTVEFPAADGGAALRAVEEISFDLAAGGALGIVGESGSGKSTTALALLGLHRRSGAQVSARSSSMRSRICACTVTSSALVGSSATRISGSHASAIAISARCRIPPENSCGRARARRAASGMPTRSSTSTARAQAALRPAPVWVR
jgi:ABC-type glutathione transport system ATPase component